VYVKKTNFVSDSFKFNLTF